MPPFARAVLVVWALAWVRVLWGIVVYPAPARLPSGWSYARPGSRLAHGDTVFNIDDREIVRVNLAAGRVEARWTLPMVSCGIGMIARHPGGDLAVESCDALFLVRPGGEVVALGALGEVGRTRSQVPIQAIAPNPDPSRAIGLAWAGDALEVAVQGTAGWRGDAVDILTWRRGTGWTGRQVRPPALAPAARDERVHVEALLAYYQRGGWRLAYLREVSARLSVEPPACELLIGTEAGLLPGSVPVQLPASWGSRLEFLSLAPGGKVGSSHFGTLPLELQGEAWTEIAPPATGGPFAPSALLNSYQIGPEHLSWNPVLYSKQHGLAVRVGGRWLEVRDDGGGIYLYDAATDRRGPLMNDRLFGFSPFGWTLVPSSDGGLWFLGDGDAYYKLDAHLQRADAPGALWRIWRVLCNGWDLMERTPGVHQPGPSAYGLSSWLLLFMPLALYLRPRGIAALLAAPPPPDPAALAAEPSRVMAALAVVYLVSAVVFGPYFWWVTRQI